MDVSKGSNGGITSYSDDSKLYDLANSLVKKIKKDHKEILKAEEAIKTAKALSKVKFIKNANGELVIKGAKRDIKALLGKFNIKKYSKYEHGVYEIKIGQQDMLTLLKGKILPLIGNKNALNAGLNTEEIVALSYRQFGKFTKGFKGFSWNTLKDAAKSGVKGSKEGFKDSFKMFKGLKGASKWGKVLKGGGGALELASAGFTAVDEYGDAKKRGLSNGESITASGVSTVATVGGDSAIMYGSTAIGTAICPGLGTVIGFVAGMGITWLKDHKFNNKNSINDKITDRIDDSVKSIGDWLGGRK